MTIIEHIHGLLFRLFTASKTEADQAHNHKTAISKELFIQSRASLPLILSSLIIVALGAWLPRSSLLAGALGLVPLPFAYWPLLAAILLCYMVLTQVVKTWFIRRYAID